MTQRYHYDRGIERNLIGPRTTIKGGWIRHFATGKLRPPSYHASVEWRRITRLWALPWSFGSFWMCWDNTCSLLRAAVIDCVRNRVFHLERERDSFGERDKAMREREARQGAGCSRRSSLAGEHGGRGRPSSLLGETRGRRWLSLSPSNWPP